MAKEVKNKIDINAIVKRAQAAYGKAEGRLANKISTGTTIFRPTENKHFVLWQGSDDFWQKITGTKGLEMGRITQFSGSPDSGKSSTAASFMKYAQDQDVLVILLDSERKFAANRFDKKIGGDSSQLITITDNSITRGAIAVANVVHAVKEQNPDQRILIVWDSVTSSLNSQEDRDEEEDETFSKQPGVSAKENGWMIRKLLKLMSKYENAQTGEDTIAVVLINQTYANIGSQGQKEAGGAKIAYHSSLILQFTRKKDMTRTSKGEVYKTGIISRCKVKKNHIGNADENIAELDVVVGAGGVQLASNVKTYKDLVGWGEVGFASDDDEPEETQFSDADEEEVA